MAVITKRNLQRLGAYLNLEEDWDSYGASPITEVVATEAMMLMIAVEPVASEVFPLASGGIQVEWATGESYSEVKCYGEGVFDYLYCPSEDETQWIEKTNLNFNEMVHEVNSWNERES